uniref:Uncharacterized protein n=1 Tax=Meloidogyne enterolobii TaxID=390850 RepID=A0A6V7VHL1_MELEN|nr:unnamed protein product [Meloidogyne enterolobii]
MKQIKQHKPIPAELLFEIINCVNCYPEELLDQMKITKKLVIYKNFSSSSKIFYKFSGNILLKKRNKLMADYLSSKTKLIIEKFTIFICRLIFAMKFLLSLEYIFGSNYNCLSCCSFVFTLHYYNIASNFHCGYCYNWFLYWVIVYGNSIMFLAIISFCLTCIFAGRLGLLSIRQRSLINKLNQFRDEFIVYVNSRFPVPA